MTFCGFWDFDCLRKMLGIFSRPTYGLTAWLVILLLRIIWRSSHYARFCHVIKVISRAIGKALAELFTLLIAAIFTTRGAIALLGGWFIGSAWFYLSEAKYALV